MSLSPQDQQAIAALETQFPPSGDADARISRRGIDAVSEIVFVDNDLGTAKYQLTWRRSGSTMPERVSRILRKMGPSVGHSLTGSLLGIPSPVLPSVVHRSSDMPNPVVMAHLARAVESRHFSVAQPEVSQIIEDAIDQVSDQDERERVKTDIEYLLKRLSKVYAPRQAHVWLDSHNPHLNARPLDVLVVRGVAEVITALEVEEQNAF